MKKIKAMKTNVKYVLLTAFALFSIQLQTYAQRCAKTITYTVLEERTFQVPVGTEPEALSQLDINMGKPETKHKTIETCIDERGYLTTTTSYELDTDQDYRNFPVAETTISPAGAVAKDFDGNVVLNMGLEEMANMPGVQSPMSNEEVEQYGLGIDLSDEVSETDFSSFESDSYWTENAKTFVTVGGQETIIDTKLNYVVSNTFSQGQPTSSVVESFRKTSGIYHPNIKVNRSYTSLSNGDKLQITHKETYLTYKITQGDAVLVDYDIMDSEVARGRASSGNNELGTYSPIQSLKPSVKVYPNPAQESINIDLNGRLKALGGSLSVHSIDGKVLLQRTVEPNAADLEMNVEQLPAGIYFIRIQNQFMSFDEKFVKQ